MCWNSLTNRTSRPSCVIYCAVRNGLPLSGSRSNLSGSTSTSTQPGYANSSKPPASVSAAPRLSPTTGCPSSSAWYPLLSWFRWIGWSSSVETGGSSPPASSCSTSIQSMAPRPSQASSLPVLPAVPSLPLWTALQLLQPFSPVPSVATAGLWKAASTTSRSHCPQRSRGATVLSNAACTRQSAMLSFSPGREPYCAL